MIKHKFLLDDFGEFDSFTLIAIHCTLEDYRLVYMLNQKLNLKLRRKKKDLNYSEAKYSIFEWEDSKRGITWDLVSNFCRVEQQINKNESLLFGNQTNITQTVHLVPEFSSANYLLKIMNQTILYEPKEIIDLLVSIPQIVLAYEVDTEKLKSKTNLIFN